MGKAGRKGKRPSGKTKVAIIGGGCAGMAAAWQLANLGYDVSVYEKSWRLGGKGASGRDANGRIHEHGLHVWLGFYENAFRMVRDCYKDVEARGWGPGKASKGKLAHARFEDAFFPEPHVGVAGKNSAGKWDVWSGHLPPVKGLPGDDLDPETNPFTLASYLLRCFDLLKALMLSVIGTPEEDEPGKPRPDRRSKIDERVDLSFYYDPTRSPELLIERIAGRVRDGTLTVAAALLQAVTIIEIMLQDLNHNPQVVGSALNLLVALTAQARKQLRDFVAIDEDLRRKTEIIDIVITIAVGLYRDRVLFEAGGLDAINDMDYREWLRKHGATRTAVDSPFITGIYDLVFAYEGGDRRKPRLAAGVALRGALRMFFTYRGAMFWRMRSGMGDAVFAPLYKVLLLGDRKGTDKDGKEFELLPVKFHFLHELSGVEFKLVAKERRFVTKLTFKTRGRRDLVDDQSKNALDEFGCWPVDARRFEAAAGAQPLDAADLALEKQDFHAVIFATGLDDFARFFMKENQSEDGRPQFRDDIPRTWRGIRRPGRTVATRAAQVWLAKDLEQLGWYRGPGLISALGLQFDTWADMTHTLATERAWRKTVVKGYGGEDARSVAYFCGVVPDRKRDETVAAWRARMDDQARRDLDAMLAKGMQRLWPLWHPSMPGQRTDEIADVVDRCAHANTADSDRYSLSLPGTIRGRISPLDRSVLNMTVAGDWTACGLDAGCVEGAVMSGMLAAHAITGEAPSLESIVGYDHP